MSEVNKDPNAEPEIVVNKHDGVVAVEEADRTVLLTPNDTIIVEKQPQFDFPPSNRPRKVYGGIWGPVEIGAVGAASLAVVAALAIYFFFTLPAKRELERNRATAERLEADMVSARAKYGDISNIEVHVAKLNSSVDDFESQFLPVAANGNTALYQKLNGLIAGYGLVNTNGPDYAPLEINDQASENQSESERGRARFRSLFPGTYVTTTVEGSYSNLRRFIREIETGNDFVIISSIELQPSDKQGNAANSPDQAAQENGQADEDGFGGIPVQRQDSNQPRRQSGRTLGQVVSLRLEMAAYYKRPVMEVPPNVPAQ